MKKPFCATFVLLLSFFAATVYAQDRGPRPPIAPEEAAVGRGPGGPDVRNDASRRYNASRSYARDRERIVMRRNPHLAGIMMQMRGEMMRIRGEAMMKQGDVLRRYGERLEKESAVQQAPESRAR